MSARATFTVFGFQTTHDAMRAESALETAGVVAVLIPTPKALGTLCGLSARVPSGSAAEAARVLESAGVRVSGSVEIEDRANA